MFSKLTFASALLAAAANAGNTAEWKQRSVYQVLTDRFARGDGSTQVCTNLSNYCGGDYQGMINKLDYIQGMGFDAIWISPIVDNLDPGYHGYWARNWEALNSHFGSEQDLHDLVSAAHAKGIWVMVDVVANHTAPIGSDYSQLYPFNQSYHFHGDCQIQDWNNQSQVENCRLADLPDLNQDNDYVRGYLKDWIKGIVQKYDFDGIRIDTIPEVPANFWSEYGEASGVFQMGECFNGDPAYVGPYQNNLTALFNYPMYYSIGDVFGSGKSMYDFRNRFNTEDQHFNDVDALGIFVDNHDNPRFMNRYGNNKAALRAAEAFILTARGIPFTYYATEQYYGGGADPKNRESLWQDYNTGSDLYEMIGKINAQRKHNQIWDDEQVERYVDDQFYSYSRGSMLVALTNQYNGTLNRTVTYLPYNNGDVVCDILSGNCETINNSQLNVNLNNGYPQIWVLQGDMNAAQESVILQ